MVYVGHALAVVCFITLSRTPLCKEQRGWYADAPDDDDDDDSEGTPMSSFEKQAAALERVSVQHNVPPPPRPVVTLSTVKTQAATRAGASTQSKTASSSHSTSRSRTRTATETGDRTITKVVKILQEMLVKSKADGEEDDVLFAKYKCYCDSNTDEKETSIKDITESIGLLRGKIAELTAENGKLSQAHSELETDMAENERGRETASSLRSKARTDFIAEEEDMKNAIAQMNQAISTLAAIGADNTIASSSAAQGSLLASQATGGRFMSSSQAQHHVPLIVQQANAKDLTWAAQAIEKSQPHQSLLRVNKDMKAALNMASMLMSPGEKRKLDSFLQAPGGHYSAESGEIVGILKNMRDTFETNLANARQAEKASEGAHSKFVAVQLDAHSKMTADYQAKGSILSDNDDVLATKRDQKDTAEEALANDQEFLAKLKRLCETKTREYDDRKMIRANEEAAVAQAISILNSDDSFDTFGKVDATKSGAMGASFLQLAAAAPKEDIRAALLTKLQTAAQRYKSLRLARVAVTLENKANPFDKVIEQVESMIALIAKEGAADAEQFAWCTSEREVMHEQKTDKEAVMVEIEGVINSLLETLNGDVDGLRTQLAQEQATLSQNLKDQADTLADRKFENAEYTKLVKANVDSQETIKKAVKSLQQFYDWLHAKQGPHHYEKTPGKDSGGGNIKRVAEAAIPDLEEMCSEDPECLGFNSEGWMKMEIKAEDKLYDVAGTDLYVKVFDASNPVGLLQRGGGSEAEAAAKGRNQNQRASEDPAPPSTFEAEADAEGAYAGQSDKGGDVVGMLNFILSEAKKEEQVAHETEEASQHQFEDEITELQADEADVRERIAALEERVAEKVKELEMAQTDLKKTETEKTAIEAYLLKIRPGCDFITMNIDEREEMRAAEQASLQEALDKMKDTPAFKEAEAQAERDALGECADACIPDRAVLACQACLAETTEEAYCAARMEEPICADREAEVEAATGTVE